jgi:hypothetical protein
MRTTALVLVLALAACNASTRSTAGQTPLPSQTSMAQANSTAAPDLALSAGSGEKIFAQTGGDLRNVTFSIWANGRPVTTIMWPSKSYDMTGALKGHANVVVVKWNKMGKGAASGTLTIRSHSGVVLTARVTPSSPASGQVSKTIFARQVRIGR